MLSTASFLSFLKCSHLDLTHIEYRFKSSIWVFFVVVVFFCFFPHNLSKTILYPSNCSERFESIFLLRALISCEPQLKALWQRSSFGWNGSLYSGGLPDLCGGCGARVSRSATVNCECLHVDLLLSIYVIPKLVGGLQERGGCHGLVNHRYVLTHTLDLFG